MNNKRAFTLIELLVVIAIIAILAAILFPVFAQAKLAAKKTQALSNAKQIATANMIYMGDYDDSLIKSYYGSPPGCDWTHYSPNSWDWYSWRHALSPYTKSTGLLTDTTNPFVADKYWVDSNTDSSGKKYVYPNNFATNTTVIGFANGECLQLPWTQNGLSTLNTVDEVAGTILFVPSRTRWNDMRPTFISSVKETKPDWCINSTCPSGTNGPIHAVGKQAAFVWADGHAKSKSVVATLDPSNATRDDWGTKYSINPYTNLTYTQADRQQIASEAWGEYK